jgi:wyosine [tRNA(Phe)-imidazoG37] synthetase (radical SAM superfamily)
MIEHTRNPSLEPHASCVFGPVQSRRLGRVICVGLVPHKVCTFDCIYCERGPTTRKTIMRDMYCDFPAVVAEIRGLLHLEPDYIALTGAGEPLIQGQVNQLMQLIRTVTDVPIAVMSNGGLFWRADVRAELMDADIVLPSLDAGDKATLQMINRPHARITVDDMIDGLIRFRRRFKDRPIWMRTTLVGGVNDSPQSLDRIRRAVRRIGPDRLQIRTAVAPSMENSRAISPERLERIMEYFGENAEIIDEAATAERSRGFRALAAVAG